MEHDVLHLFLQNQDDTGKSYPLEKEVELKNESPVII